MTEFCHVSELKTGPSKRDGACSILSQRSAEPLVGTAYVNNRWLMIEHPGPWPRDAVDGALDADLLTEIRQRAEGVRLTLVRKPGVRTVERPRAFLASAGRDPWMREVQLGSYEDLRRLNLESLARGAEPFDGEPVTDPVFFVCTHGRKEICCAEFGRPVLRALDQAELPVWEVTHIGGDRFAASMMAFPEGYYFGHLSPLSGLSAAREYTEGRLQLGNLRGLSGIPNCAQVADCHLRSELGLRGISEVEILDVEEQGAAAEVTLIAAERRYRVRLEVHEHTETLLNGCSEEGSMIPRRCWTPLHHEPAEGHDLAGCVPARQNPAAGSLAARTQPREDDQVA